ncbi:MAG: sporulation integral membrane protein YlbJ [Bacillota bacterium]
MSERARRICFGIAAASFVAGMAVAPQAAFEGARLGLNTWWEIVVPALLPFFIGTELLMTFGVVRLLSALLEPVMRPIFALPGAASFALAMGYTSGYPMGAIVVARLRHEGLLNREEAERAISFCNNASPLFMLVAVSVGMFGNPRLGPFILAVHYGANFVIGVLLGLLTARSAARTPGPVIEAGGLRVPGSLLGDAVAEGVKKILQVGGFIVLFAVVLALARHFGLLTLPTRFLGATLNALGLAPELAAALVSGFFEMTLGTRLAANSAAPLVQQLMVVQALLAWGGLSIQAQIAAFVAETDIRLHLYYLSRAGHIALSTLLTVLLFPYLESATPTMAESPAQTLWSWWTMLCTASGVAAAVPVLLLLCGLTCRAGRRLLHVLKL